MLTIYGRDYSSNVQLAMWAVGELGLEHERLNYGHVFGGNDTAEFLAMNPMGLVPVLRDGDVVMFESAAILRYLAARYGSGTLWPENPSVRGPLDTWAEWGKNTFAAAVNEVFWRAIRTPPSKRDKAAITSAVSAAGRLAAMLDARLGAGPWLAGETFSFADIAVGHILHRYHVMEQDWPDLPAFAAYYARLQTRPAYREHAMKSIEALRGRD
jgi:glutathione S-transferase